MEDTQKTQHVNANVQGLPAWAAANFEIQNLTDLYQQQLADLSNAQASLMEDNEKLAEMLAPFVTPDGRVIAPPDENILFLKQGLDLRLSEFEEECRRIQMTERRLQRKIEECTINYESMVVEAQGMAESKLLKQIKEQQKIIQLQQREIEDIRLQRDTYEAETRRLRQLCRYGDWVADGPGAGRNSSPPGSARQDPSGTAHRFAEANKPATEGWFKMIRHANLGL